MRSSETLLGQAKRSLKVAEQVLIKTYPLVRDPKLILAVAGDIYAALTAAMDAVLVAGGRQVQGSGDDFDAHIRLFSDVAAGKGFQDDELDLIGTMRSIIESHKESPVEFPRKDDFVICDERYDCRVISVDDMKKYLFRAGLFVERAEAVVKEKQIR